MGKGRIKAAEGGGLYTIEMQEDRRRLELVAESYSSQLAGLQASVIEGEGVLTEAQQELERQIDLQDAAITAAKDGADVNMAEFIKNVISAAEQRDKVRVEVDRRRLLVIQAQTTIARFADMPPLRSLKAWCADLTEDLVGEVATVEIPGEATAVQVRPGYSDAAAYNAARDGAIQPVLSSTPAATFYNLAMLPGWQKWRPTYRYASITSIDRDANTCSLDLEVATSSAQGLGVNAQRSYSGVPINYMNCHAVAFEAGDRVLVAFVNQDSGEPTVIGFADHPKPCSCCAPQVLVPAKYAHLVTQSEKDHLMAGHVVEQAGSNARIRFVNPGGLGFSLDEVVDADGNVAACKGAVPEGFEFNPVAVPGEVEITEVLLGTIEDYSARFNGLEWTYSIGSPVPYGGWRAIARIQGELVALGVPIYENGESVGATLESSGEIDATGTLLPGDPRSVPFSGSITVVTGYYGDLGFGDDIVVNIYLQTYPRWCRGAEIGCYDPDSREMTWPQD